MATQDKQMSCGCTSEECENWKEPVSIKNNCALGALLAYNVSIPNYQRGYCWEEQHIKPLLEALWAAAKGWSATQRPYHLGTMIFHIHGDVWDVVDGQQRLITLSILQYCLSKVPDSDKCARQDCKELPPLLHCATSDVDMLWHVHNAAKTIKEWISDHPIEDIGQLQKFLTNGICVTVVKIQEQESQNDHYLPLAWTFFNALNSGGKSLSDYDLLKAHHLRYLATNHDELTIHFKASRWDFLGEQSVPTLFGRTGKLYDTSFAHTFYLIRTWLRNRQVDVCQMPADGRYCILKHYSALLPLATREERMSHRITGGIAGGKPFFDWAEYWLWQYRNFCDNPIVARFLQMPWKEQQTHLLVIARAVLFYYFCRFGNVFLADACIFILYRIGKLRNTRQRLNKWYGNDGKYVHRTIEALDESPSPEHFFHYCQMASNRYMPQYDLKNTFDKMSSEDKNKLAGWNHGPDWWKRFLALTSSTIDTSIVKGFRLPEKWAGGIGEAVSFRDAVRDLLNEIARDFGWAFDESLKLARKETQGKEEKNNV